MPDTMDILLEDMCECWKCFCHADLHTSVSTPNPRLCRLNTPEILSSIFSALWAACLAMRGIWQCLVLSCR